MTSQSELGRRFSNGATSGSASNVEICECDYLDGAAYILGYGHAVYGYRFPDGFTIAFMGWDGYSSSTTQQLSKLGLRSADAESDDSPRYSIDPKNYEDLHDYTETDPVLGQ